MLVRVYALLVITGAVSCGEEVPVIQAPWGTIQGVRVQGDGERRVPGYLAIPYALPPVGELRFERPVPHPGPGEGQVFVADRLMPACPQVKPGLVGSAREVSEDCLMLDVYVPSTVAAASKLPVMVWIHGGGFTMGDASFYRPTRMVEDERIIVVVIQYRLGVFGFFTSGDYSFGANFGLFDQTLALRWINTNIQAFGGDPGAITIAGESAGSMSVGAHLLSPYSRGLFQRAFMQSGTPQLTSPLSEATDAEVAFSDVIHMFGCEGGTSMAQIKSCLQKQPLEEFFNKTLEYSSKTKLASAFMPCVDGDYLPADVLELLKDEQYMAEQGIGDIPVTVGFGNREGALVLILLKLTQSPLEKLYTVEFFEQMLDMCLLVSGLEPHDTLKTSIHSFYRGDDTDTKDSVQMEEVVDMYGDCLIYAPTLQWLRGLVSAPHTAPRYLYVMDHEFHFNSQGVIPGSHHGDELILQFDNDMDIPEDSLITALNKTKLADHEQALSAKFIKIFTSFVKTGNPTGPLRADLGKEWPKFSLEQEEYVSIQDKPEVVSYAGEYGMRAGLWLEHLPTIAQGLQDQPQGTTPEPHQEL